MSDTKLPNLSRSPCASSNASRDRSWRMREGDELVVLAIYKGQEAATIPPGSLYASDVRYASNASDTSDASD